MREDRGCTISQFLNHFHKEEDGAVTVDWVALAAAIVGLGVVITTAEKARLIRQLALV